MVAFANAYGLRGLSLADVGLSIVEAVLDLEPAAPHTPWRPGAPPPPAVEPLCGRWWWMGREFELRWDDGVQQLVMECPPLPAWRFTEAGPDRWLGLTGEQAGEVLTVLRDDDGQVRELDIATFRFSHDPLPPA